MFVCVVGGRGRQSRLCVRLGVGYNRRYVGWDGWWDLAVTGFVLPERMCVGFLGEAQSNVSVLGEVNRNNVCVGVT